MAIKAHAVSVVVALALVAQAAASTGTFLDIHLRLTNPALELAEAANAWVTAHGAPHNGMDLSTWDRPHITLYLTEFRNESVPAVLAAAKQVANTWTESVSVPMLDYADVVGSYAMWQVGLPKWLQTLSNAIVNATVSGIVPNQPIPGWVTHLPQPERERKEAMIRKYGSPNVFSEFQPHVSLAWDDTPGENLTAIFDAMPRSMLLPVSFDAAVVGIAYVGPHGTVPRNATLDIGVFGLGR